MPFIIVAQYTQCTRL